jgi:hypothetical protein
LGRRARIQSEWLAVVVEQVHVVSYRDLNVMKIRFDSLVTETSQRLYGLSSLIELIYRATPEVELQERDALKQLAEQEKWEYGDYSVEGEFLDVKFKYWLPKFAAYSIIILLSSIVETQLLAYARKVGERGECAFNLNDLRGSALDRAALYVKRVSGTELTKNARWQTLKDLQDLRDIIVHRAGRPGDDKKPRVEQIRQSYEGISLDKNPYTIQPDLELDLSIHLCRSFAREVEGFFKDLFKGAGLPVETGLWPNI